MISPPGLGHQEVKPGRLGWVSNEIVNKTELEYFIAGVSEASCEFSFFISVLDLYRDVCPSVTIIF